MALAPGSKEYGILSVLYALWADVDIPLRFPPGAFEPPPKVGSALLRARFLRRATRRGGRSGGLRTARLPGLCPPAKNP